MAKSTISTDTGIDSILANLPAILNATKGTSGSQTTQTAVSPEAVSALLRQMLGGSSGLAQLQQNTANTGLYNSTTNQQLTNDLLTKAAGEVALKSAPTTVSSKTDPQVNLNKILATMAAKSAASKLMGGGSGGGAASKGKPFSQQMQELKDSIFGKDDPNSETQSSVDSKDIMAANSSEDPIGSLIDSQNWSADSSSSSSDFSSSFGDLAAFGGDSYGESFNSLLSGSDFGGSLGGDSGVSGDPYTGNLDSYLSQDYVDTSSSSSDTSADYSSSYVDTSSNSADDSYSDWGGDW